MPRLEVEEELEGVGEVRRADGKSVGMARYSLLVHREMHPAGPGEPEIPGLRDVSGKVEGLDNFGLMDEKRLTLELEDGRRLDFFIADLEGCVAPTGRGLYDPGEGAS